jgi:hypothetical protein
VRLVATLLTVPCDSLLVCRQPTVAGVTPAFPRLHGRRLDGVVVRLPDDLPAPSLVVLAFHQRHQRDVDGWLARVPPGVPCFEVPLLGARWTPARPLIDGGMARGIGDPVVLARTVTVYGQVGDVRRAFGLDGTDDVVAAVVTPQGRVAAWALGPASESGAGLLLAELEGL